jgi:hypothetical protein
LQHYDLALNGYTASDPWPNASKTAGLAHWQVEVLRLWLSNIGRSANTADIVLFRGLLDAKEDAISAGLQLLLTSAPQDGKVRATPQDDFLTAPSWMQQSVPVLDDHVTVPMPGSNATPLLEGSLTADNDMQPLDHGNNFQALSNMNDQFPVPNLSPARLSSRGKGPQVEHDTFEILTSHHGSALSDRFAKNDGVTDCDRRLRAFIGQLISKKATKGCGHIRSHEHQSGKFVCTLGCGRRFRTSADTFRHEEVVFPQQFWFCYTCGDRNDPSERYLFTREDKMRQHIKKAGHVTTSPNHCRVPNIRTFFPEKCNICSHHRHRNWKERCKHIIWHCKRGHFATNTNPLGTGQTQEHLVTGGDDDDDDDDDGEDDDDEDGDNHRLNDLTDQGNGEGPSNWKPNYDNEDNDGDNGDEFFERWMRDSPGLYDYPSSVRITSFHTPDEQSDVETSIAWIKWNKKQATYEGVSSMFTVEVLSVLEDGVKSEPRTCIVKQYPARHHDLFEREVQALTVLQNQKGCANTSRCLGTFEYIDDSGQQKYNVLLEHSESKPNPPKPHHVNSIPASTMSRPVTFSTNPTMMYPWGSKPPFIFRIDEISTNASPIINGFWRQASSWKQPHYSTTTYGCYGDLEPQGMWWFCDGSKTIRVMHRTSTVTGSTEKMTEWSQPSSDHIAGSWEYEHPPAIKKDVDCPGYCHDRSGESSLGSQACPATGFTSREAWLAKMKAWTSNEQSNPILWLSGIAGTGKSTIARTVAQSHQATGSSSSFFFSSQRNHENRDRALQSINEASLRQTSPDEFSQLDLIQQRHTFTQWNGAVSKSCLATEQGSNKQTPLARAVAAGYGGVVTLLLGAGNNAFVEEVQDSQTLKVFARKTIGSLGHKDQVRLFQNELNIMRKLKGHQHIIKAMTTYMTRQNCSPELYTFLTDPREARTESFSHTYKSRSAFLMDFLFLHLLLLHLCYNQPSFRRGCYIRHSVSQGRITKRSGRIQARSRSQSRQSSSGRALHIWSCMLFQCDEGDESAESASC